MGLLSDTIWKRSVTKPLPIYAWDATVFLAWLGAPVPAQFDKSGLDAVALEIANGGAKLVTSTMAYLEVLKGKHTPEQIDVFERFMKRTNVVALDIHMGVIRKAETIRTSSLLLKPMRCIKSPDSIFAASAMLLKADALHSLDSDLLNLNGMDVVDKLKIVLPMPRSGQPVMAEKS